MIIQSFLFILIPFLSGVLLIHLIWQDRDVRSILIKLFLGVGIGLGLNSLFYFIYLLLFNHGTGYLIIQVLTLIILIVLVLRGEKNILTASHIFKSPSYPQILFLIITGGTIILALFIFFTISANRIYGAWDAWAMYNRTARFIFRGGVHWRDAFSSELAWYFHADYPPLVALNIASGWSAIGEEAIRVPVVVGGAFLFGSAGLLFAGIYAYKTLGQATLAIGALFAISGYVGMGSVQISDIPLAFFILATGVLIYIFPIKKQKELFLLAGLTAGLAAWTKNEGFLFVFVSFFAVLFTYRNNLMWYAAGLVFPMFLVLFFKITIAPSGDLFTDPLVQIYQIVDINRHLTILESFWGSIKTWGNWNWLILYTLFFGFNIEKKSIPAIKAGFVMLFLQLCGYYGIFLITSYSLEWHLLALTRILLQVAPLFFFFYFSIVRTPESIFQSGKVALE